MSTSDLSSMQSNPSPPGKRFSTIQGTVQYQSDLDPLLTRDDVAAAVSSGNKRLSPRGSAAAGGYGSLLGAGGSGASPSSPIDLAAAFEKRPPITLSWRDLTYEVPIKNEPNRRILNGVSGHVRSGQMLALLGPSGAGKTTMLDLLAQRAKGGERSGELLMNGHPINPGVFRRVSAYVQQEDIMHSYLTVRETITFNAKLRLSEEFTDDMIDAKVSNIMKLLGIDHIQNNKIGGEFNRGISGGEKKRCAIALELVTSPSLLFLDEPTTGLDTFTALHLITVLKNLAKTGTTIIMSIHQPRSSIYRLFDLVLVLNGYGEESYYGAADKAVAFLQSAGVRQDFPDNPADFLLDSVAVIRAAESLNAADFPFLPPPTQSQDIAAHFRSTMLDDINGQIDVLKRSFADDSGLPPALQSPYYRPVSTQIYIVSLRAFINKVRDPIATVVAIIVAIFFAVLIGSIYFRLGKDYDDVQNRLGVLFFLTMNTAFSNLGSLAIFLQERNIYVREHNNGMYRPSAYYIGKLVQDVPIGVAVNLVFNLIAYYMVGLQPSFDKFILFFLMCTLVMLNSFGLCMWISNMSKNYQIANLTAPLILVLYLLPSGFLINLNSIPVVWRWIKYISFFRYGFQALVENEFTGLTFSCPAELKAINPANCSIDGMAKVSEMLGFEQGQYWISVWAVGISMGIYLLLGYLSLRFLRSAEGK
jgi:ATP-binding cassette subfamily G (WHITE) protein 2